jgi:hypothetical protein
MAIQLVAVGVMLPAIARGEAVEQFIGEVMFDVVRYLTPPVGVGGWHTRLLRRPGRGQ